VESRLGSRQFSVRFITLVAVVTGVLALLAWLGRDGTLGLSAAVLGLYTLHLMSIRYILDGQAQNRSRLDAQWRFLQLLVDPNVLEPGERVGSASVGGDQTVAPGGNGGDPESAAARQIPTPRHFALGTVALIRKLLTPAQVAHVLVEQRNQPDERFAAIAVDLGLLTEDQREELLLAQQEGLFTDSEMREAHQRLREFRMATARALSTQR
jgi:hypothetical protein